MLIRVLYVSRLAPATTPSDVARLVGSAQRRNRQLDITGVLALCERQFAQVLEGRPDAVDEMLLKIAADPRHVDMHLVERADVSRRLFGHWDMAFVDDGVSPALWDSVRQGTTAPADLLSELCQLVEWQRLAVH